MWVEGFTLISLSLNSVKAKNSKIFALLLLRVGLLVLLSGTILGCMGRSGLCLLP